MDNPSLPQPHQPPPTATLDFNNTTTTDSDSSTTAVTDSITPTPTTSVNIINNNNNNNNNNIIDSNNNKLDNTIVIDIDNNINIEDKQQHNNNNHQLISSPDITIQVEEEGEKGEEEKEHLNNINTLKENIIIVREEQEEEEEKKKDQQIVNIVVVEDTKKNKTEEKEQGEIKKEQQQVNVIPDSKLIISTSTSSETAVAVATIVDITLSSSHPLDPSTPNPSHPDRLYCRMHRSSFILTQLGQNKSDVPLDDLMNEANPDTGMGYKAPGPQGFLSYTPTSTSTSSTSTTAQSNHHSQKDFKVPKTPAQESPSSKILSSSSKGLALRSSSNGSVTVSNNNNNNNSEKVQSARFSSSLPSLVKDNDSKRKSSRMSRMQKNEEERRKRKEQKRARSREKPIYVSCVEELPPECIKMIKKSKIPDEKIREHFEILLPILRFRTGFNLKSSHPSSSPSITPTKQYPPISPELNQSITGGVTTTTTTTTTATFTGNVNTSTTSLQGVITTADHQGEDESDGDGSRLEHAFIPKGTTELFEKGDVKKMYKGLKQIGSGGFGSVYLAKSTVDKCEVAIKKIAHSTPKAQRTNLNEIGYLHFCNHQNIVGYLRSHLVDDQVWIAMEYMQGGTLTEACSNHTFNESCIAYVAKGMLEGLRYLHSNQLVHRDIKSGNIMMTIDGKIKIVDFGLCVDSTQRKLTHMAGSPFWMSPEMIRGEGYSCPSDLWSFGICLLELANGEPPNRKSSLNAMFSIATIGCSGLDRPEKWSDNFKHFLSLCLEVNQDKRATAEQLLNHPWLSISENPETMKRILSQIFIANVMNHLDPI